MGLTTTTIGAWPKGADVPVVDWFAGESTMGPHATLATNEATTGPEIEAALDAATRQAVADQVACGIDVPTDGEMRRENYLHYHCRHLRGIDFERLTERTLRAGSWRGRVPTWVGEIEPTEPFLDRDWRIAQASTGDRPVKLTVPGPITLMDSTADAFYGDDRRWGEALAAALNAEVLALAAAGCTQIQIDEPAFARYPVVANELGFDLLAMVLDRVPAEVTTTLHICCGYPDRLDNEDYPKAHLDAYVELAAGVDASPIDIVSLEDAHRPNDLALLDRFERVSVALGVVAIARSAIENVDDVAARLDLAASRLGPDRLLAAPDCGLGLLTRDQAMAKLQTMSAGVVLLG